MNPAKLGEKILNRARIGLILAIDNRHPLNDYRGLFHASYRGYIIFIWI